MTNAAYTKLTARLIAAWFIFSLLASATHLFRTNPDRPPIAIGLAVLIPIGIFAVWAGSSKNFRQFLLSLNVRTLVFVDTWRIAGYTFLVLYTYAILPGIFALPAGWGDIAIGVTAPLVAARLINVSHRKSFIAWQILGIADLVMAVTLAATARLISPHAVAVTPMTVLPLSLIPTFAVPLLIIFHTICIAQARGWDAPRHTEEPTMGSLAEKQQAA